MGTAVLSAILQSEDIKPKQIYAISNSDESQRRLADKYQGHATVKADLKTFQDKFDAVKQSNVVVLGCKPYALSSVTKRYEKAFTKDTILISLLAGKTLDILQSLTPVVARIMTNTPAQYGCGTAAVSMTTEAQKHQDFILKLANCVGLAFTVPESSMDACTSLVGSGPAFCLLMMESLMDGGVRMGLTSEQARLAAAKVMEGTAKMVLETGEHPATLKAKVCTPGGTTIGGLLKMEDAAVRSGIARGVEEAAKIAQSFSK